MLRLAFIKALLTEPHHSNQNLAERRGQDVKGLLSLAMQVSGAPLHLWCYCIEWICDVLNHIASNTEEGHPPAELHDGETKDISCFRFYFWEPVEYKTRANNSPESPWKPARFLGIARDSGNAFTFLIRTEPQEKHEKPVVLTRSVVRSRDPSVGPEGEKTLPSMRHSTDDQTIHIESLTSRNSKEKGDSSTPPVLGLDSSLYADTDEVTTQPSKRAPEPSDEPGQNQGVETRNAKRRRLQQESSSSTSVPEESTPVACDGQTRNDDACPSLQTRRVNMEEDDIDTAEDIQDDNPEPTEQTSSLAHDIMNQLAKEEEGQTLTDVISIRSHRRHDGIPEFLIQQADGEESWIEFQLLREDYPEMLADYILTNPTVDGSWRTGKLARWAHSFKQELRRTCRRLNRLYHRKHGVSPINAQDELRDRVLRHSSTGASRKTAKKKKRKNPGRNDRIPGLKYGVEVPRTVREALELDKQNGNTLWADAIEKEINALLLLDCFEFQDPKDWQPPGDYQYAPLRIVFDVKSDLCRKARLVVGGHVVDADHVPTYASVVHGLSTQLMHVIANKNKLDMLVGDVGNAFVNAYTNEKVYSRAGPEFGDREGSIVIIKKALYGLKSSAECWHSMFSDSLRKLGFSPTRFDRDVWIRDAGDHYEYIFTHVDDFTIVSKDPWIHMRKLQETYTIKDPAPPKYYLGNDFEMLDCGKCLISCSTYLREALRRIEKNYGTLKTYRSPMEAEDHPEDDESPLLDSDGLREYQVLLGTAQWLQITG